MLDKVDLKKEFRKYGIDTFGVCDATLYNQHTGADYKTCIVALFPYFCGYDKDSNLSIYAQGTDYHIVARDILTKVAETLELGDYEVFADTGPHIERRLCVDSGLAFVGRNGMCISRKYGSYFFVGYIVCRLDLELSQRTEDSCMNCMRCVNECPGNALLDGFDISRCLSHITQKRGELTEWETELVRDSGSVFGCDICQKVCPHNRGVTHSDISLFTEDRITNLSLDDIDKLSNKAFREKYGNRAFSWRGKGVLCRNLQIINPGEVTEDEDSNT